MRCQSLILAVTLTACGGPLPAIDSGRDAADPAAPVPAVSYPSVMAGSVDYRPVAPGSWADMNERVGPRTRRQP